MGEEHRTYRWGGDPTRNQRRLTVHDAARSLGITEDAVRMRIKRGTLSADKEGGRLYVLLDNEPIPDPTGRADELVEELRDRVRYLERQVEEERNARFRADQLLARLMERVPDLESPARVTGAARGARDVPGKARANGTSRTGRPSKGGVEQSPTGEGRTGEGRAARIARKPRP